MSAVSKLANSRRVPEAKRQRTLVSCDRCKKKRIRCIRLEGESDPCKACSDHGVSCMANLPRKQRIYGSAETLSIRFKALEALVRGLFKNENLDDVDTIYRLAAERQIAMPVMSEVNISKEAFAENYSLETRDISLPKEGFTAPWPYDIDHTVQGTVTSLLEETCIPAPHGVAHYVGPASSFEFASAVRRLVAKRSKVSSVIQSKHEWRHKLQAEFANLKTSIAMEPRIETHPVSMVRRPPDCEVNTRQVQNVGQVQTGFMIPSLSRSTTPTHYTGLEGFLPTKDVANGLVQTFFDHVHPNYVLFHRGMFQSRYESIWRKSQPSTSEPDSGWSCCLAMILAFGAQHLENQGFEGGTAIQRQCLRFVRQRFQDLSLTASLSNVQALLLLQLYEHNAGERNTAWILLGQATRMAIALGMHREGASHNFEYLERNTRRLVWFTIYSFEQYTALTLGRPTTMKVLEVNVSLPDETILDGGDFLPEYFRVASALMDLSSKVRYFATAASPSHMDQAILLALVPSAANLSSELCAWKTKLPCHLQSETNFMSDRHRRTVMLLHITLHYLMSVVTRPFLLHRINFELDQAMSADESVAWSCPETIQTMAAKCVESSILVADALQQLSQYNVIEGVSWVDFFYLYHALMILCLHFLVPEREEAAVAASMNNRVRCSVASLHYLCRTHRLGPTYSILSRVAVQFAHIVGLAESEPASRDELDSLNTGPPHVPIPAIVETQDHLNFDQVNNYMPYVEPISDLGQFYNSDDFWDFFGIGESTPDQENQVSELPTPFANLFDGGSILRPSNHTMEMTTGRR